MAAPVVINPASARAIVSPFLANRRYVPVIYTDGALQQVGYVEWAPGSALTLDGTSIVQSLITDTTGLAVPMSSMSAPVKSTIDAITAVGGPTAVTRWPQRVFTATAITTLTNSAAETSIVPSGIGNLTIPDTVFSVPGYAFRFEACGTYTNTLTGIIQLKIKVGASVSLLISALALPNLSSKQWYAKGIGTVRSARLLNSFSVFSTESALGTFDDSSFSSSDLTIPAGNQLTDFTAKWAVAAIGSALTVNQLYLELIPPTA